jgi:hypothetical protein
MQIGDQQMTNNQNAAPAPANLHETRKQLAEAKRRHPAGSKTPAKKAPAKAPAPKAGEKTRKAPSASGKAKLRWDGDVAKAEGVEVGRRVEKDGAWSAVVKVNGKNETLASGLSHDRAYSVVVAFYHRGERPAVKKAVAS